jgi:uncharacterized surface anchored protein
MVLRDKNQKANKLSIEQLRQYSGNENLSDGELELQSDTLLELSLLLYDLYQTNNDCEYEDYTVSIEAEKFISGS